MALPTRSGFFLGMAGAHRFYASRSGSGFGMLALFVIGLLTLAAAVGGIFLGIDAIWVLVDRFLIPGWIRSHNMDLVTKLTGGATLPASV